MYLQFHRNKLYSITFTLSNSKFTISKLRETYDDLQDRLNYKYSEYKKGDDFWKDKKTHLWCENLYFNSKNEIVKYSTNKINPVLRYSDEKLHYDVLELQDAEL